MISGLNILKSNKLFVLLVLDGLTYMGLDKGAMSSSTVVTQAKES